MSKIFKTIVYVFTGLSLPMIAGGIIAGVVTRNQEQDRANEYKGFVFIKNEEGKKVLNIDLSLFPNVEKYYIYGPTSNQSISNQGLVFTTPGWYTIRVQTVNSGTEFIQVAGAYITEACWE